MSVPAPPSPIGAAFEISLVVFVFSVISAILATGAPYPPTAASLYYPALVAGGMAVAYYAGARHIMLPLLGGTRPQVPP